MISIIIPSYNEEKRIGKTLDKYCNFLRSKLDFEILVVLNNCNDNTLEVVKNAMRKHKEIRYLNFKQGGKGFAIIEGFKDVLKRKNDLIGFVDADMSTSPEAFYDLIKNIKNYDGIIASRRIKGAQIEKTLPRTIISFSFNFIVRSLFLLPYQDTQCGAKLFKRETIEEVIRELTQTGWIFDIDLLYRLKKKKFKIKEFPTVWEDKEGTSIRFVRTSLKMFLDLMKMRYYSLFSLK